MKFRGVDAACHFDRANLFQLASRSTQDGSARRPCSLNREGLQHRSGRRQDAKPPSIRIEGLICKEMRPTGPQNSSPGKAQTENTAKPLIFMVPVAGVEPATY